MLFATPPITPALEAQLRELDDLRQSLGERTGAPRPWLGALRRQVRASSVASSVAIEGYRVPAPDAAALVAGEQPPDPEDDDRMAVAAYGHAMDHVATLAIDPHFRWLDRVVLDLHFDACRFQRDRWPGLWRTTPIHVTSPTGGRPAYVGPDPADVPDLMAQVLDWLQLAEFDAHVAIRAAMAHLHVVCVHPFADGNGRISRIVQSLVLARDGLLAPEFGSIEEYLGRNTQDYYRVLARVQGGSYLPARDAGLWVRFCVTAHLEQARERLHQINTASARWAALERLVDGRGWPVRLVIALQDSLLGGVERAAYARQAEVSLATATADLRRLVDAGLVVQSGRARATRYLASAALRAQLADQP